MDQGQTPPLPYRLEAAEHFDEELDSYDGWYKTNRHFWRDHWPEYAQFFFGEMLPEPHSTKQLEDVVGFALETSVECMLAEHGSARYVDSAEEGEALLAALTQPVLVIQGTDDRCQPQARMENLVRLTGRRAPGDRGLRTPADGAHPDRGEPGDQAVRRPGDLLAGAFSALDHRLAAAAAPALPELTNRPGTCPPRPRHRRRDPRCIGPTSRSRG